MSGTIFTDDTFEKEVLKSEIPVLVDFWAEWCQPCKMVNPLVEELSEEFTGKLKVGKINVDENSETPGNYSVMSIPTLIIFKKGEPVKTLIGVQSKDVYKRAIEEAISS